MDVAGGGEHGGIRGGRRYAAIFVAWTLTVVISLLWNLTQEQREAREFAAVAARAAFVKDISYRSWNAGHGGVYVPVTETNRPNPYLTQIPSRDVVTDSGLELTLVNPAYMTRQVHELGREHRGVVGHITSLNPIRPANAPDDWERHALRTFQEGDEEYVSLEMFEGRRHLRLMRPLVTGAECLKCHAQQGYQEGDIRGGISVSVPMEPYRAIAQRRQTGIGAAHAGLWLLGTGGIAWGTRRMRRHDAARNQAVKAYREAREYLETALANSPSGVLIADAPDVTIRVANQAARDIRGNTSSDLTGIDLRDHSSNWQPLKPDGSPYPSEQLPLSRAVLHGEGTKGEELIIRDADGEDHWVVANAAPVRDAEGRVTAGIVVFHDLTEQKHALDEREELEEQLHQAQKMEAIGQLSGGIAHDFNNILQIVNGSTRMAMDEISQDVPACRYLEQTLEAAKRGAALVNRLLAFGRRQALEMDDLIVDEVVADTVQMIRDLIGDDITVTFREGNLSAPVRGDAGRINRIMTNLCLNAKDAMPRGGEITVRTEEVAFDEGFCAVNGWARPGRYAMIRVSDTGCGMDADTLERAFEPFFTTKEEGKGTGLGLSTVYGLVKQHEGLLHAESTVGVGTSISVYFPLRTGA